MDGGTAYTSSARQPPHTTPWGCILWTRRAGCCSRPHCGRGLLAWSSSWRFVVVQLGSLELLVFLVLLALLGQTEEEDGDGDGGAEKRRGSSGGVGTNGDAGGCWTSQGSKPRAAIRCMVVVVRGSGQAWCCRQRDAAISATTSLLVRSQRSRIQLETGAFLAVETIGSTSTSRWQ